MHGTIRTYMVHQPPCQQVLSSIRPAGHSLLLPSSIPAPSRISEEVSTFDWPQPPRFLGCTIELTSHRAPLSLRRAVKLAFPLQCLHGRALLPYEQLPQEPPKNNPIASSSWSSASRYTTSKSTLFSHFSTHSTFAQDVPLPSYTSPSVVRSFFLCCV